MGQYPSTAPTAPCSCSHPRPPASSHPAALSHYSPVPMRSPGSQAVTQTPSSPPGATAGLGPLSVLGGLCPALVWSTPSKGLGPAGVGDVVGDVARTFAWSGVRAVTLTQISVWDGAAHSGPETGRVAWRGGVSAPRLADTELRRSTSDHAREEANTPPGANLASPSQEGQAQALALGEEGAAEPPASSSPLVAVESHA